MAEQSYSTVDVESQSWANIGVEFQFYGGPTLKAPDLKAAKWKTSLEVGVQKHTSGQVKQYTRGVVSQDGSIVCYAGGAIVLVKACIAIAKALGYVDASGAYQYGRPVFDVPILHTPYGETEIRKVRLIGCRIKSDGFDGKLGPDPDETEMELIITRVERVISGDRAVLL
jgi:hypothetical protein